eukprot:9485302-Pyramimonas_sp.AAC.1
MSKNKRAQIMYLAPLPFKTAQEYLYCYGTLGNELSVSHDCLRKFAKAQEISSVGTSATHEHAVVRPATASPSS